MRFLVLLGLGAPSRELAANVGFRASVVVAVVVVVVVRVVVLAGAT